MREGPYNAIGHWTLTSVLAFRNATGNAPRLYLPRRRAFFPSSILVDPVLSNLAFWDINAQSPSDEFWLDMESLVAEEYWRMVSLFTDFFHNHSPTTEVANELLERLRAAERYMAWFGRVDRILPLGHVYCSEMISITILP
jgi:hypothetical protein